MTNVWNALTKKCEGKSAELSNLEIIESVRLN